MSFCSKLLLITSAQLIRFNHLRAKPETYLDKFALADLLYLNMLSKKPSKKSNTTTELSAAPITEQTVADSKPAKRTKPSSAAKTSPSSPIQTSHRHSKVNVPASPVVEEVITEVIVASTAPVNDSVTSDDIARLAYSFFEQRNFAHGSAEEDWFRAEKTLAAKR